MKSFFIICEKPPAAVCFNENSDWFERNFCGLVEARFSENGLSKSFTIARGIEKRNYRRELTLNWQMFIELYYFFNLFYIDILKTKIFY